MLGPYDWASAILVGGFFRLAKQLDAHQRFLKARVVRRQYILLTLHVDVSFNQGAIEHGHFGVFAKPRGAALCAGSQASRAVEVMQLCRVGSVRCRGQQKVVDVKDSVIPGLANRSRVRRVVLQKARIFKLKKKSVPTTTFFLSLQNKTATKGDP